MNSDFGSSTADSINTGVVGPGDGFRRIYGDDNPDWICFPELEKCFRPGPAYCLMADLVGFGALMKHNAADPVPVAADSARFFLRCLGAFTPPPTLDLKTIERFRRKFMRLSDTVIMWAYTWEEDPETRRIREVPQLKADALRWMVCISRHLMQYAFKEGWVLRGAITYGKILVNMTDCAVIGRPWTEASQLEKRQQWSGISLDPEVEKMAEGLDLPLVRCSVPVRDRMDSEKVDWRTGLAVNWRDGVTEEHVKEAFRRLPEESSSVPRNGLKLENTQKFLRRELDIQDSPKY